METNSGQEMRVAVKCKVCQRVIFYKTCLLYTSDAADEL